MAVKLSLRLRVEDGLECEREHGPPGLDQRGSGRHWGADALRRQDRGSRAGCREEGGTEGPTQLGGWSIVPQDQERQEDGILENS